MQLAGPGNGTVQLHYQHLKSDGYLTLNAIKSDNYMHKRLAHNTTFLL